MARQEPTSTTGGVLPQSAGTMGMAMPPGLQANKITVVQEQRFDGPIPSPDIMTGYAGIDAGFPGRIMAMAEAEQRHRHESEREVIRSAFAEGARGQHYALAIGVVAIVAGAATAMFGQPLPGGFIGGAGVIGLVAVFILGRNHGTAAGPIESDKPEKRPQAPTGKP